MSVHALPLVMIFAMLIGCVQAPRSGNDEGSSDDNRARVHTELSAAYYGAGQYDVAMEEVKVALEANQNYLPAINQLGLIHIALGQTDEAKKHLERAIRQDPDDPSINNNYGMLLCSLGDQKKAMDYFEKALSNPLYRTPEFAYVNAGLCLKNSGDYAGAGEFLNRALALAPDQPQALYQMADLTYRMGDARRARGFITRHLQRVVPGPDALWLAARIEKQLGNSVALESFGAQLNRRFPESAQTRAFNRGQFR